MSDFTTVTSVGGLLPTDLLARVAANDIDLPGTSAEDYGLVPGERLNDHVTRSWNRLVGLWQNFQHQLQELPESERTATTLTRDRWTLPLLDELGFAGLPTAKAQQLGGKDYPISHEWDTQVPVHLPGARILIDRRTPGIPGAATTSPHGLVQEYLNRSDHHLWGLVSNGLVLRLLRDNASLTRQAYVEFDLAAMFDSEAFSDFVLLWLCCHRTRFAGDPPEKCLLEQWSQEAVTSGTRALDKLRDGVETAITELGEGFVAHPANGTLRDALRSGSLPKDDYQRQLLRIVYRLLFLLVAESRDLLLNPAADATAKERYRRYYSVDRLRRLARARRGTSHDDLWAGLTVVMRALHHDGAPSLALAPLGSFLWSPDAIANLTEASIDNRHLLDAVRALTLVRDDESRVHRSVDYRNLGAEELGSVYESLLELHAEVDADARTFRLDTAAGNERKTTGSYYTPTSLITELLDSALDPVLEEACKQSDPETAILDLSMIDMAIGSGHFAIAAANRIAQRLASIRAGGVEPAPDEVRTALRDVIGRCIHGIDINPMAVELCKVSLWLEAMEPGKPLSFLDHRIVCGDALLGTTPRLLAEGIPDDAFKPLLGDDKSTVVSLKKRNKQEREGQLSLGLGGSAAELAKPLADAYAAIDAVDDSSLEKIDEKYRLYRHLSESQEAERARLAADAWCAAFVAPKTAGEPEITTDTVRRIGNDPASVDPVVVDRVRALAEEYRFLHLHLAFPDQFSVPEDLDEATNQRTGWSDGISFVLGNPPWERVKLQEKEFFAERDPQIAAARNSAERKKLIDRAKESNPELWREFNAAWRHAEGQSHILRTSGRYPLCGLGRDINTAYVFAESAMDATSRSGRAGMVMPAGVISDDTTKFFVQHIMRERRLVSFHGFENERHIFEGIDHRVLFGLLTLTGDTGASEAEFAFYCREMADIGDGRSFTLSFQDLQRISPLTGTCPVFRSERDASIVTRAYTSMSAIGSEQSDWMLTTRPGHFHMSNDSSVFILDSERPTQREAEWLSDHRPLYEAKMVHLYDHRYGTYAGQTRAQANLGTLPRVTQAQHDDPTFVVTPRYWVTSEDLVRKMSEASWLIGVRDITRNNNKRTLVPSALPRVAMGGTLMMVNLEASSQERLAALSLLSSFALDYIARQRVAGIHMNPSVFKQIPFPSRDSLSAPCPFGSMQDTWATFLALRAFELTYTSWDLERLAQDTAGSSHPPFRWIPERRDALRHELDAAAFHIFGMPRQDIEHCLDSFNLVSAEDLEQHGEYRTKRLILECYDRMSDAQASDEPYETVLDPPPADPSLCHPQSTRPDWADLYLDL